MSERQRPTAPSLTLWNTLYWAYRTARSSWSRYQSKRRPVSLRRLVSSISPDLHYPIFVVGAPRSGTTFLGECLGAVPRISYHFEPVATKIAVRDVYMGRWSEAKARRHFRRVYKWLMRVHLDGDLTFAEKTPHNSLILPFLLSSFPTARLIHIIRDGRDVAASLVQKGWYNHAYKMTGHRDAEGALFGSYARYWVDPAHAEAFENTTDAGRAAWVWRFFTEAILEFAPCMPGDRYLEVRYEDLVRHPDTEAERLIQFLALSDDDANCAALVAAAHTARVSSIGNWRKAFGTEDLASIEQTAGALLAELGYWTARPNRDYEPLVRSGDTPRA